MRFVHRPAKHLTLFRLVIRVGFAVLLVPVIGRDVGAVGGGQVGVEILPSSGVISADDATTLELYGSALPLSETSSSTTLGLETPPLSTASPSAPLLSATTPKPLQLYRAQAVIPARISRRLASTSVGRSESPSASTSSSGSSASVSPSRVSRAAAGPSPTAAQGIRKLMTVSTNTLAGTQQTRSTTTSARQAGPAGMPSSDINGYRPLSSLSFDEQPPTDRQQLADSIMDEQDIVSTMSLSPAPDRQALASLVSRQVDVTHFGAKGDGTTDDTIALQRAIDAAAASQVVYFPPKQYLLSNTLRIRTSGLSVEGSGATLIIEKSYQILRVESGTEAISVNGLTFQGNSNGVEQRGLQSDGRSCSFKNIRFLDLGGSGYKDTGSDNVIASSTATNCYSSLTGVGDYGAFALSGAQGARIESCTSVDSRRSGISLSQSRNCTIKNATVISETSPYQLMGIYVLDGSKGNTFESLYIKNTQYEHFDLRGEGEDTISGLTMEGTTKYGLSISFSKNYPKPKNIKISKVISRLDSGPAIHFSTGSDTEPITDVEISESVFNKSSNTYTGILLRHRTNRITISDSIFNGCGISHEDGSFHGMLLSDCTFADFNNAAGKLLNITQTQVKNCVFRNITAKSLVDRTWGSRRNIFFSGCLTDGTNNVQFLTSGSDAAGQSDENIIRFQGNRLTGIPLTSDYSQRPPAILP